jgi:hypothetical protein
VSAWRKTDNKLRKQGVSKQDRPVKPKPKKEYPTKSQIGLRLLESPKFSDRPRPTRKPYDFNLRT